MPIPPLLQNSSSPPLKARSTELESCGGTLPTPDSRVPTATGGTLLRLLRYLAIGRSSSSSLGDHDDDVTT